MEVEVGNVGEPRTSLTGAQRSTVPRGQMLHAQGLEGKGCQRGRRAGNMLESERAVDHLMPLPHFVGE